ncbi:MAG TPA: EamA family transporter [Blastocatellia bacterium]|nr:EamA family transporter [Blastocatellia bacterium]
MITRAKTETRAARGPEQEADNRFGAIDLLLLLMTVIWGANFSAIKYSLEDMLPLSFNGLRFALASLTLLTIALASGINLRVSRGDGWRLFGLGLLANAVYQSIFITGMAHTRTGNAALIVATAPLFIAVISRIRKQEYFTRRGLAGLMLALAGIVMVILSGQTVVQFGETIVGDCLLVASTICWSLYTIWAKRLVNLYGAMKATTIMMIMGTPVFLVICAPSLIKQDWTRVRTESWAGVVYSALFAIALAHFIWNYAVRKIGSTRTAIYSNVTPVTAMIIAWVALGERPTVGQIVGAAVIFLGLYLVRGGMRAVAEREEVEEEIEEMEEASLGPGKN